MGRKSTVQVIKHLPGGDVDLGVALQTAALASANGTVSGSNGVYIASPTEDDSRAFVKPANANGASSPSKDDPAVADLGKELEEISLTNGDSLDARAAPAEPKTNGKDGKPDEKTVEDQAGGHSEGPSSKNKNKNKNKKAKAKAKAAAEKAEALPAKEDDKDGVEAGSKSYTPGDREIVAAVVDLWKEDKEAEALGMAKLLAAVKKRNPTWGLSEKRLKASLKEFNLTPNQPLFTYVKQTVSSPSPQIHLPPNVKLMETKTRGLGLFATKPIAAGEELWAEGPLVQAPKVEFARVMRSGTVCTYCANPLRASEGILLAPGVSGVSCADCPANWCDTECKRADLIHMDLCHETFRNKFSVRALRAYEDHCVDNDWKAGFLAQRALMYKIKNDPRRPGIAANLDAMAKIGQDIRQEATAAKDSLDYEQFELMWKRGHQILSHAVSGVYKLSYREYLELVGMVNLNNVGGCLFLNQSNLNHNCTPNVSVDFQKTRPQGIKVTAKVPIQAGQELLVSYVNPKMGVEERRANLRINWGFLCSCDRCKHELAELKNKPPAKEDESLGRKRTKSVHFDNNPVTQTVQIIS